MTDKRLKPYAIYWAKGDIKIQRIETEKHQIEFFRMKPTEDFSLKELPTEFFNHQILDINTESIKDIEDFSKEWGFVYSPLRNLSKTGVESLSYRIAPSAQNEKAEKTILNLYDTIFDTELCIEAVKKEYSENRLIYRHKYCPIISIQELKHAIELTQKIIRLFMGYSSISSFEFGLYSELISSCSCNNYYFPSPIDEIGGPILKNRGLLISAILNQMLETFSSNDPWKKCANEKCYKYFKQKQSNAISGNTKSKYCCKKCEYQQSKRNQRNAAKNRNNPTR